MRKGLSGAERRDAWILGFIAVLYVAGAAAIALHIAPFPGDPDYQYLLSGLDILTLRSLNFVDHPGTPVQSLIALIGGVTWLARLPVHGFGVKLDDILGHSQIYLTAISAVFTIAVTQVDRSQFHAVYVLKPGWEKSPSLSRP